MESCKCESVHHFPRQSLPRSLQDSEGVGTGHRYMDPSTRATQRARWVGEVCDECARTHMQPYVIPS